MSDFLIARDGQQYGPYSEAVIKAGLSRKRILPGDLCWTEGMAEWQPVSAVFQCQAAPPPPPPPDAPPAGTRGVALWNPGAAAGWSLYVTPAFGAFLQARNWAALGETAKAKSSMIWYYASLALLAAAYIASGFASTLFMEAYETRPDDLAFWHDLTFRLAGIGSLMMAIYLLFLGVWYFTSARPQSRYVKEKFGTRYPRKSWGAPLLIAMAAHIACSLFFLGGAWAYNEYYGKSSYISAASRDSVPFDLQSIGGMHYDQARKILISNGYRPINTAPPKKEKWPFVRFNSENGIIDERSNDYPVDDLWKKGFYEVVRCYVSGGISCQFVFLAPDGRELVVYVVSGDTVFTRDGEIVDAVDNLLVDDFSLESASSEDSSFREARRKEYVESCLEGLREESIYRLLPASKKAGFCECAADKFFNAFTVDELKAADSDANILKKMEKASEKFGMECSANLIK
jgi:hypothetical protein